MEYDTPTTDASPENLLIICNALTDGSMTVDEMTESEEVGLSRGVIQETVKYGKRLGFLEQEENSLSLSPRGYDIAFDEELTSAHYDAFAAGVGEHPLYSALVESIIENEMVQSREEGQVGQKQILAILNRDFGFQELSSGSTLKPATNTFLSTLEAAGFGNYVIGRGGNQTRIEVNGRFPESVSKSDEREQPEQDTSEEDNQADLTTAFSEDDSNDAEPQDNPADEPTGAGENVVEVTESSEDHDSIERMSDEPKDMTVNIEINISSEDWDSEEVTQLLNEIKNS